MFNVTNNQPVSKISFMQHFFIKQQASYCDICNRNTSFLADLTVDTKVARLKNPRYPKSGIFFIFAFMEQPTPDKDPQVLYLLWTLRFVTLPAMILACTTFTIILFKMLFVRETRVGLFEKINDSVVDYVLEKNRAANYVYAFMDNLTHRITLSIILWMAIAYFTY